MNLKKKLLVLSSAMVGLLLCALLPLSALAAGDVRELPADGGGLTYEWIVPGERVHLTISGSGPMEEFFDPAKAPWAAVRDKLAAVTVGEGITALCSYAFADCTLLETVELPSTLVEIHQGAFWGCVSLRDFAMPAKLRVIESGAFFDCRSLETVVLPPRLERLGQLAFFRCKGLRDVLIQSPGVIERAAFTDCGDEPILHFAGTQAEWERLAEKNALPPEVQLHFMDHTGRCGCSREVEIGTNPVLCRVDWQLTKLSRLAAGAKRLTAAGWPRDELILR